MEEYKGEDTYAKFAARIGVEEDRLYKWRRGEWKPDLTTVRDVARRLGIPPLELLVRVGFLRPEEAGAIPPYTDPLIGHVATALANRKLPADLRRRLRILLKAAWAAWLEMNGSGAPAIAEPSGDELTRGTKTRVG